MQPGNPVPGAGSGDPLAGARADLRRDAAVGEQPSQALQQDPILVWIARDTDADLVVEFARRAGIGNHYRAPQSEGPHHGSGGFTERGPPQIEDHIARRYVPVEVRHRLITQHMHRAFQSQGGYAPSHGNLRMRLAGDHQPGVRPIFQQRFENRQAFADLLVGALVTEHPQERLPRCNSEALAVRISVQGLQGCAMGDPCQRAREALHAHPAFRKPAMHDASRAARQQPLDHGEHARLRADPALGSLGRERRGFVAVDFIEDLGEVGLLPVPVQPPHQIVHVGLVQHHNARML